MTQDSTVDGQFPSEFGDASSGGGGAGRAPPQKVTVVDDVSELTPYKTAPAAPAPLYRNLGAITSGYTGVYRGANFIDYASSTNYVNTTQPSFTTSFSFSWSNAVVGATASQFISGFTTTPNYIYFNVNATQYPSGDAFETVGAAGGIYITNNFTTLTGGTNNYIKAFLSKFMQPALRARVQTSYPFARVGQRGSSDRFVINRANSHSIAEQRFHVMSTTSGTVAGSFSITADASLTGYQSANLSVKQFDITYYDAGDTKLGYYGPTPFSTNL